MDDKLTSTWLDDSKQVHMWSRPNGYRRYNVYLKNTRRGRAHFATEEEARRALQLDKEAGYHTQQAQTDELSSQAAALFLKECQTKRRFADIGAPGGGPTGDSLNGTGSGDGGSSMRACLSNRTPHVTTPVAAAAPAPAGHNVSNPTSQRGLQDRQRSTPQTATAQHGRQPQQCSGEELASTSSIGWVTLSSMPLHNRHGAEQQAAAVAGSPEAADAAAVAAAAPPSPDYEPAWDVAGSSCCVRWQPGDTLQLTCVEQIKDGGWLCTEEQLQLRVVKPLGCGGMSEVYQAELLLQASDAAAAARPVLSTVLSEVAAPPTGMRMLAVKAPRLYEKLPPDTCAALSCDDYLFSVYAAFKKELSVTRMAGTDTPHILRCFAYTLAKSGSQPQVPALVMQLAEGGNLQQQLTPAPEQYAGIDAVPAWEVMTQVASALVALHTKARVVYEDLKPGNILAVEEHGKLRYILADFGGCRRLGVGNTAAAGCVGGTAAYMTPEVAAEQEHSITADTFSLGCLLYALRTGQQPWQHVIGVSSRDVAASSTFDELSSQPQFDVFDEQERTFLQAALQQDWRERPTVQQLVQQEGGYLQAGPNCVAEPLWKAAKKQSRIDLEQAAAEAEHRNLAIFKHWLAGTLAEYAEQGDDYADMP